MAQSGIPGNPSMSVDSEIEELREKVRRLERIAKQLRVDALIWRSGGVAMLIVFALSASLLVHSSKDSNNQGALVHGLETINKLSVESLKVSRLEVDDAEIAQGRIGRLNTQELKNLKLDSLEAASASFGDLQAGALECKTIKSRQMESFSYLVEGTSSRWSQTGMYIELGKPGNFCQINQYGLFHDVGDQNISLRNGPFFGLAVTKRGIYRLTAGVDRQQNAQVWLCAPDNRKASVWVYYANGVVVEPAMVSDRTSPID